MIIKFSTPFRYVAAQARRFFAWVFGFETLVTDAEWGARIAECEACPHLKDEQCEICTCFVDGKAMLALERCPKKKWLRVWRLKRQYTKTRKTDTSH